MLIVTRGTREPHTKKEESVLTKLENEGYRASKKSQTSIKKKPYGWDIQSQKTASDRIERRRKQSTTQKHQHTPTR